MSNVRHETVQEGVVAEFNGGYFGIQYEDGQCTEYGFGPIEKATIANPEFCKTPMSMTWKGSHYVHQLEKATLRRITKRTIYEVAPC